MPTRSRRFCLTRDVVASLTLVFALIGGASGWAASPIPTARPSAIPSPSHSAQPSATPAVIPNDTAVLSFLGDVISWSRDLNLEQQVVELPGDLLYFTQNKSQANRIVGVAFDFAKAESAVLDALGQSTSAAAESPPRAEALEAIRAKLQTAVKNATDQVKARKAELAAAAQPNRAGAAEQLAKAQGDLELAQARLEFFNSINEFQKSGSAGEQASGGLLGRIAELEQTLPPKDTSTTTPAAIKMQSSEPSGVFGHAKHLLTFERSKDVLRQRTKSTHDLIRRVDEFHQAINKLYGQIDARVQTIAGQAVAGGGDSTVLKQRKGELDKLLSEHTALAKVLPPLGAEELLLKRYDSNLQRWLRDLKQRSVSELRVLIARLVVLAILLGGIFGGAVVWRQLTFRYVRDLQRRHQLLQLRTFTVVFLVALVLLFNFTTELAALATIMGFAAAGIAFALQNVILSLAGYFLLTGRFGIRVGDRVELGGVRGDVIEVGLIKLTLMELTGEGNYSHPTGRVVVIPNSVVFQPTASFFKQAPGLNFSWNELRLVLAPDCDYRLAEKLLMGVVEQVFERYQETVRRECRLMERRLNVEIDPPKPQSFLRLSAAGLEVLIRYPAEARNAIHIADEVSRLVLETIAREPSLRLVAMGTPSIQASAMPASDLPGAAPVSTTVTAAAAAVKPEPSARP
jgi:small-conductance mechanosensitive channel